MERGEGRGERGGGEECIQSREIEGRGRENLCQVNCVLTSPDGSHTSPTNHLDPTPLFLYQHADKHHPPLSA